MTEAALSPGMRVICRDAEWRIKQVRSASSTRTDSYAIHCVGTDTLVRGHEAVFLTDLDQFQVVDPRETRLVPDNSAGFNKARLYVEACLRQMPITSTVPDLNNMGVFDPYEFQRQSVMHALEQPRVRLLLADDVGLGKTIQAGMIVSELMRRGRAGRILVLARKSMLTQFQSEFWNRFTIPLVRLDSRGIEKLRSRIPANKNPFEIYHRVIISVDTLKTGPYRVALENTNWDVVIIDEAHNVAGASVPDRHLSHKLARLLANKTENLLLTTATPHNGDPQTFGRLISLLDPSAIADPDLKKYSAPDIAQYFLMRFKEEIRDQLGDALPERVVIPMPQTTIDASDEEEEVFSQLGIIRDCAKSQQRKNSLLEYGIYKLFLSSPDACRASINKRIKQLKENSGDEAELSSLNTLRKAIGTQTVETSSRFKLLVQELADIGVTAGPNSPRVVIFTEYIETQKTLALALARHFNLPSPSLAQEDQAGQAIAVMHGSFSDEYLAKLIESFATGASPVRILIATDVASEGLNLHHQCSNLIHYDIPWSIITLIQRNGRIDRFGQKHPPVIRYLMLKSSQDYFKGDERIFNKLIEKVDQINHATRAGESVLKLYDPKKEEEYVARQGIVAGEADIFSRESNSEQAQLESTIDQSRQLLNEDFLRSLGESESKEKQAAEEGTSRLRLLSDLDFLQSSYKFLRQNAESYPPLAEEGALTLLTPPEELAGYLGSKQVRSPVIFGATAIPDEAFPEDSQFRLTTSPARVNLAIEAARQMKGYWTMETLCTDQHPILHWVTERMLMLHGRNEAPYVTSPWLEKGELCFCFIGQLSSMAGTPLVCAAHAVSFFPGGKSLVMPLREALSKAQFEAVSNTGNEKKTEVAANVLRSAVEASLAHMSDLQNKHFGALTSRMRKEERRLREWKKRREEFIVEKQSNLSENSPHYRKLARLKESMADSLKARKDWLDKHFLPSEQATTQPILVIEGVR